MGLKLKDGAQYADPRNGQLIPSPYAVVVRSEGNRRLRQQVVEVNVFRDQRAWESNADPLDVRMFGAEGEAFDTFFAPAVLKENNTDPYSAAEDYVLQLPAMIAEEIEDISQIPLELGDLWEKESEE